MTEAEWGESSVESRTQLLLTRMTELVERYADGDATPGDLADAHRTAEQWVRDWEFAAEAARERRVREERIARAARLTPQQTKQLDQDERDVEVVDRHRHDREFEAYHDFRALVALMHTAGGGDLLSVLGVYPDGGTIAEVIPSPFRPVPFDPCWRSSDALGVAEGVYAERAWDLLPILADALADAGCEEESILSHCRGGGLHVRGCWVLDLVLGKS